jgi:hypothetical protein
MNAEGSGTEAMTKGAVGCVTVLPLMKWATSETCGDWCSNVAKFDHSVWKSGGPVLGAVVWKLSTYKSFASEPHSETFGPDNIVRGGSAGRYGNAMVVAVATGDPSTRRLAVASAEVSVSTTTLLTVTENIHEVMSDAWNSPITPFVVIVPATITWSPESKMPWSGTNE